MLARMFQGDIGKRKDEKVSSAFLLGLEPLLLGQPNTCTTRWHTWEAGQKISLLLLLCHRGGYSLTETGVVCWSC